MTSEKYEILYKVPERWHLVGALEINAKEKYFLFYLLDSLFSLLVSK